MKVWSKIPVSFAICVAILTSESSKVSKFYAAKVLKYQNFMV